MFTSIGFATSKESDLLNGRKRDALSLRVGTVRNMRENRKIFLQFAWVFVNFCQIFSALPLVQTCIIVRLQ